MWAFEGRKLQKERTWGGRGMALGVLHPDTASTNPLSSLKREN